MCDGTKGKVDLFDGLYRATFDGDVFESDYTRIEGISTGDIVLTIKKGQSVWPEWIGDDEAEDLGGKQYRLEDGQWVEQTEKTDIQADHAASDAA